MDKIKKFLTLCASIVLTAIAVKRLLDADSWQLWLFGGLAAFIFGLFSLFLLFENKIRKSQAFKSAAAFAGRYRQELNYSIFLFLATVYEIIFFFYTPENPIMNGIRTFLLILFAVGIITLAILLVKLKRDPSRLSGSQRPHE